MDLLNSDDSISSTKPTDTAALQSFVDNKTDPQTAETKRLVAQFEHYTDNINRIQRDAQRRMASHVQVRRDVVADLVENRYGKKRRTYREVAEILGISAARVGQLMKESSGYVEPFPEEVTGV